jgi:oligopeptide/dipeptide ABC transporter ATP-binding protein
MAEPLVIHGIGNKNSRNERVSELLSAVALDPDMRSKYPSQLSGGQLQRVNIARALALEPKLLICVEPVSALDVSVQAQIVNLFLDIQKRLGVAMLFISHDLAVVRHISDRIVVMYSGSIMEVGKTDDICFEPIHPYTEALLLASSYSQRSETESRDLHLFRKEEVPDTGCPFSPRCAYAQESCKSIELKVQKYADSRGTACVRASEIFSEQFTRHRE